MSSVVTELPLDAGPPGRGVRQGVQRMLVACVFFALMALCAGEAHRLDPTLSTAMTSLVRSSVNLVALVLLARGNMGLLFGDRRAALWVRGVTGGLALVSYFAALERVGIGEAAFLNQTSAVWVAILAPLLLREPARARATLAVAGSIVGVLLLTHPRPEGSDTVGRIIGLVSGLCAAGAYLSVRRAGATNGPITIVFYFTLVATIIAGALSIGVGAKLPHDPRVWACLVGAGLAATFAQMRMTEAYALAPAALISATGAASPLLNAVAGWVFLGEVPDLAGRAGMAVLLISAVALPLLSR
jgi:drug/metabolite transporter (DMT)-like permease